MYIYIHVYTYNIMHIATDKSCKLSHIAVNELSLLACVVKINFRKGSKLCFSDRWRKRVEGGGGRGEGVRGEREGGGKEGGSESGREGGKAEGRGRNRH